MAAYFGICQTDISFSYILGVFRAKMCYDSLIGSENTAVSVCMVGSCPSGAPLTPHVKCALDTRTKIAPYTIIFKLVPKFKLLHQSEVKM